MPWLLKNSLFMGNPVYPFLGSIFPGNYPSADISAFTSSARGQFWHGGMFSWKTWLVLPWELFTKGRNSFSFIGPVLLAFAPLVFLYRRAAFPFGLMLAMFGIQYACWSSSSSMIRLLIPALPLFCLYTAHQLTLLGKKWRGWVPWLVFPIVAWNLSWNAAMLNETGVPGVVFGKEMPQAYRSRPQHSYHYPYADAVLWIHENLPGNSKILLSGDSRSYPIPRNITVASIFNPDPLLERVRHAASPEELFGKLKAFGYTHLMIGHGEAFRNRGEALRALTPEQLRVLSFFLQFYAKPLFRNEYGVAIYKLAAPTDPIVPASKPEDLPELVRLAIAHGARF